MTTVRSNRQPTRSRRWASIVAAAGLLALLSGCVVYPVGYYGPPHPYGHYWR